MGDKRNVYSLLVGKLKNKHLENLREKGRMMLK